MRTIKFRGRRIDNDDWVYGTYHMCVGRGIMRRTEWEGGNRKLIDDPVDFNRHWILTHRTSTDPGWDVRDTFSPYDVIAETVGQFTDLTDKNGKEIYEGDILKDGKDENNNIGVVYYYAPQFVVQTLEDIPYALAEGKVNMGQLEYTEVIGNIYEHPSLLNNHK